MGRPRKNGGNQTKTIPLQYDYAETVETMAKSLIGQHHPHLVNAEIVYVFRNKPMTLRGRNVVATAQKVSKKMHLLTKKHFIITVCYEDYNKLTDNQKIAVIDHELEHCFVDEDKEGNPVYKTLPHDFENFCSILQRHKLYSNDLINLARIVKELPEERFPKYRSDEVVTQTKEDLESEFK